jgi:hypothetical protein
MKHIEEIFTNETIQTVRQRTCFVCGKKTKKGDKIHHVSEIGTMTTLCDECFEKLKAEDETK